MLQRHETEGHAPHGRRHRIRQDHAPLQDWKTHVTEQRDAYRITTVTRTTTEFTRSFPTYTFSTRAGGNWQVLLDSNALIQADQQAYNTAVDNHIPHLDRFQDFSMFPQVFGKNDKKAWHDRQTQLFAANWNTLAALLYDDSAPIPAQLPCFTEVNLGNGFGHADFIGIGPDGRFVIIEFGKGKLDADKFVVGGGKSKQVCGFRDGLREMLAANEPRQPERIISPLVAYYDQDEQGTNHLVIHPPRKHVQNVIYVQS